MPIPPAARSIAIYVGGEFSKDQGLIVRHCTMKQPMNMFLKSISLSADSHVLECLSNTEETIRLCFQGCYSDLSSFKLEHLPIHFPKTSSTLAAVSWQSVYPVSRHFERLWAPDCIHHPPRFCTPSEHTGNCYSLGSRFIWSEVDRMIINIPALSPGRTQLWPPMSKSAAVECLDG